MKQKCTEALGINLVDTTLAVWSLEFSQICASSRSHSTDNSAIVVLCLSSWHLSLSMRLSFQESIYENSMQICSPFHLRFHRCCALPIIFQLHLLPALSSLSPQFSKITCSTWTPSLLQDRKWIQEGSQDAHSFHMFLSFLSRNTVPFWTQWFHTCFPVS